MFVFCAWIIAPNAYPPNSQYSCEKFEKLLASVFGNLYNVPVRESSALKFSHTAKNKRIVTT